MKNARTSPDPSGRALRSAVQQAEGKRLMYRDPLKAIIEAPADES